MNPVEAREYTEDELYKISVAMQRYGGSFASAIGEALQVADNSNKEKLLQAFPELLVKYRSFIN